MFWQPREVQLWGKCNIFATFFCNQLKWYWQRQMRTFETMFLSSKSMRRFAFKMFLKEGKRLSWINDCISKLILKDTQFNTTSKSVLFPLRKACFFFLFSLVDFFSGSPTSLEIKHTSPGTHKTTDITFEMYPPSAPSFCKIKVSILSHFILFHLMFYCILHSDIPLNLF